MIQAPIIYDNEDPDIVAALRPQYQAILADGIEGFFEPRSASCPWCEGTRLTAVLRTTDVYQHKPGRFVLDRCAGCGHVFQNPRLSSRGLEFYYKDFYDGLCGNVIDKLFASNTTSYRHRAEAIRPFSTPGSWLDVGCGHGHFCETAREAWPDTAFDGLDLSEGLELAKEHGRINQGHRGFFRDLAGKLDQYDVVSMFHYLEHTTEPRAELAAAHQVLRPGGHLVIEVPDPESPMGRVFGRRWAGWLQPQHLNMIPIGNLREALSQLGFTVLREQRAEAHDQNECVSWVALLLHGGIPGLDWPWRPNPPSRFLRAFRTASLVMSLPVLVAARLTDVAVAPIVRRAGAANVYRVVARKNTLRHAI